ncbi:MAG: murein transglycosylase A [Proteobacteria bacterium]|nr:murein transglycosylase A [Pseudomonadota bacterium]
MTGRLAGLIFLLAVVVTGLILVSVIDREPPETRLGLDERSFASLAGWDDDDQSAALSAFRLSCERLLTLPDERSLGGGGMAGMVADWRSACRAVGDVRAADRDAARAYFQTWFRPVAVSNEADDIGLFTGYYTPVLKGSLERSEAFSVPIYPLPADYLKVDLGTFRADLAGQRIVGHIENGRFAPAQTRAEIDAGALDGTAKPILWLADPIDAFFMHIQGSGRIRLDDGSVLDVGVTGTNGHAYVSIGRRLVAHGGLEEGNVSAQSIQAWLKDNPDEAQSLMQENPRYVFFGIVDAGPLGSQGVTLTAQRSLAVDTRWIALGVPVWLDTRIADTKVAPDRIRRLMVAQDTGGAITGIIRGDVYWGAGDEAGEVAGRMNVAGRYHVLLPRTLLRRRAQEKSSGR